MCKPDLIVAIRLKIVGKAEREVCARSLACRAMLHQISVYWLLASVRRVIVAWNLVLSVIYVRTASEPADAFGFVSSLRPDAGLHAVLIQTGCLSQVQYVELDLVYLFLLPDWYVAIDDFEVIPLCVAARIRVIFEPQIVLDVVDLGSFAEIAILETGVKYQHVLEIGNIVFSAELLEVSLVRKLRQMSV